MAENLENQNTQANAEPTAEELSEVLRVRREKLAALQQAGMTRLHRPVLTAPFMHSRLQSSSTSWRKNR